MGVDASHGGRGGPECFKLILCQLSNSSSRSSSLHNNSLRAVIGTAWVTSATVARTGELFDWLVLGHMLPCGAWE